MSLAVWSSRWPATTRRPWWRWRLRPAYGSSTEGVAYELDLHLFRERAGRLAMVGWLVTLVLAAALVGVLAAAGLVRAFVVVALGLTTTAFGTLLPILRDNGLLGGRFGRYLLAAGAVGELFPIFAISLFLGATSKFVALGSLTAVGVLAVVLTYAPRLVRGNKLGRVLREGEGSTAQTTVRLAVLLLMLLLAVAEEFGLDVVLAAFLAGMVLRRWSPSSCCCWSSGGAGPVPVPPGPVGGPAGAADAADRRRPAPAGRPGRDRAAQRHHALGRTRPPWSAPGSCRCWCSPWSRCRSSAAAGPAPRR